MGEQRICVCKFATSPPCAPRILPDIEQALKGNKAPQNFQTFSGFAVKKFRGAAAGTGKGRAAVGPRISAAGNPGNL
jgi:hypothetical protein